MDAINIKTQFLEGVSDPDHFDNIVNLQSWVSEYGAQVDPDSQLARQLFDTLAKAKKLYTDFLDKDVAYMKEVLNAEKKRALAVAKANGRCNGIRHKRAQSRKNKY